MNCYILYTFFLLTYKETGQIKMCCLASLGMTYKDLGLIIDVHQQLKTICTATNSTSRQMVIKIKRK